ncbi:MAG: 3-hydroxyacyl-CoA dehydrogenase NAD-binding domain-containing protein, partial [Caulobacteraceae bacterium]
LKESAPARRLAAQRMRAEADAKAPHAHYPAPFALIELWEKHGGDFEAMKRAEIDSFAKLLVSETSRNLVRVFFLRERMKKAAGKPPAIGHVHVIGAGAMGGDIAAWCAWKGLTVTLGDVDPKPIGGAIRRAAALYDKIGHKDGIKVRDALDRLIPDVNGEGVARADLVIEAAPEKAELKAKIYAGIEAKLKPGAVLATNTSSIPLQTLAETLQRPERFVGLHFFNPVSRMQLVEVVRHDRLDPAVEALARGFAGLIDRLPAPARSAPGFIVNRALTPYLAEALILMDEGVAPETIDRAAEAFGMPVGPIELSDQVGLDIAVAVADSLKRDLGWALPDPPEWLRKKVADGQLGRKTGQGIYAWKDGEAVKSKSAAPPQAGASLADLADRMLLPMLNACVAILREGVAADEDIVDGAMIFGSGFAPFRGGPMNYAHRRGPADIRAKLAALAETYGERFAPDAGWQALEKGGRPAG